MKIIFKIWLGPKIPTNFPSKYQEILQIFDAKIIVALNGP